MVYMSLAPPALFYEFCRLVDSLKGLTSLFAAFALSLSFIVNSSSSKFAILLEIHEEGVFKTIEVKAGGA